MVDVAALSAVVTPPFTSSIARTLGSRIFEEYVSVKDFGAVGDNTNDDTAEIQAAIDYCFGTTAAPHGSTTPYTNKTLFFPSGRYKITAPLTVRSLRGGRVLGSGRFVTSIQNVTSGGTVIKTNGCEYAQFEGLELIGTGAAVLFDLDWDNTGTTALQSTTFKDMFFETGSIGVRIGQTGFMGSECIFLNCYVANMSVAGYKTCNFNALQISIIGGNIASCPIGIWVAAGAVPVIHGVGFQNGSANTADVQVDNQAGDAYSILGNRSESKNFLKLLSGCRGLIAGNTQTQATAGIFCEFNAAPKFTLLGNYSKAGKMHGNISGQVHVGQCEFGLNAWNTLVVSSPGSLELEGIDYNADGTDAYIVKQRITGAGTFNYTVS